MISVQAGGRRVRSILCSWKMIDHGYYIRGRASTFHFATCHIGEKIVREGPTSY